MATMNFIDFFKKLPEGSTIDFIDENHGPVEVSVLEGERFPQGKAVSIMLMTECKPSGIYDIKLLAGINIFALHWARYKEDYYRFACTQSADERWKDESFRKHMYHQYVDTDRPITDQLYNLDDMNLKTLFAYIKEDLMRNTAELVRAL